MKNNNSVKYSRLLAVCYELEGLLLLAVNREESLPQEVIQLMSQKAAILSSSLSQSDKDSEHSPLDDIEIDKEIIEDTMVAEAAEREEMADAASQQNSVDVSAVAVDPEPRMTKAPSPIFAIGDKFRFKRELFNNSEREFAETISTIISMDSLEEIEDYLFNDLCLDPHNETVKDFIEVISASRI